MQFTASTVASTGTISSATSGLSNGLPQSSTQGASAPFADLFSDAVGQIGQLEDEARTAVDRMMTGSGVDVHQAMIATQKASIAFELALSVRNKAVQAYQSIMGMQF